MERTEFRQWAMIYAMQGLLANTKVVDPDVKVVYADISSLAVKFADALVEANTIEAKSE